MKKIIRLEKESLITKLKELWLVDHQIENEIIKRKEIIKDTYNQLDALENKKKELVYWVNVFSEPLTKKELESVAVECEKKFNELRSK